MSNEKSVLDAMLEQYEAATTVKVETTFDLKNYFTTYLPDGINSASMRVRILPVDGSPFKAIKVHSKKVDGKNRKFTCIKDLNDEPCPFCEVREELLATGDEADKELAKDYRAREMYVLKVIDRDNEADGPKFWRFPANYKKDGVFDKIMAIVKTLKQNITDAETGRDLILNVVRVKNPRGGSYPAINTIMQDDKSPLSTDKELSEKWINDSKVWQDVYSVKEYDYLFLVVSNEIPAWDKAKEKYVAKSSIEDTSENANDGIDEKISMGKSVQTNTELKTETDAVTETAYDIAADTEEDEDDLPF